MIMLTKEHLADLLREAYARGVDDRGCFTPEWVGTESYRHWQEGAIQPLIRRSSGSHDDHGREVK